MDDLVRSNAEVRAALRIAGKRIRQLHLRRRNDDPVLVKLRQVLRDVRAVAREYEHPQTSPDANN